MLLSKNLQKLLRHKGLKVSELARATKIPAQTLNNWLSNQKPRSMQQVYQVAQFFEITIEELCFGQKPLRKNPVEFYLDDEVYAGQFEVVLKKVSPEAQTKKRTRRLSDELQSFIHRPNPDQKEEILKKLKDEVTHLKEMSEVPHQLKMVIQGLEFLIAQIEIIN